MNKLTYNVQQLLANVTCVNMEFVKTVQRVDKCRQSKEKSFEVFLTCDISKRLPVHTNKNDVLYTYVLTQLARKRSDVNNILYINNIMLLLTK